ncbi:Uncharacterised protein [Serratia liquefaciens]|nr:Uncharacterised protein [Serratia grimesii]SUI41968.1 Uncharacterised protein [Serratia liquefaciens]
MRILMLCVNFWSRSGGMGEVLNESITLTQFDIRIRKL